MSDGYIDSASFHHVILALRHPKPLDWAPWVWEVVEGVTSALWSDPQFQIAPDPSPHRGSRGPFDRLLMGLSLIYAGIASQDDSALKATRRWVRRNPERVRSIFEEVKITDSFSQWLDWYMSFFFVHHCDMHGALFTHEFIPQLSQVLGCSPDDLERVYQLSCDRDQVGAWVRKRPHTEDFGLAVDAFALSTLLRGRYHDYAAKNSNVRIMHHPMREIVLPDRQPTSEFLLSNTEQYLTKIVFAGALAEPTLEGRIETWAENILKIRLAITQGRLDLGPKDSATVALDLAINAANQADIRVYPRFLETVLDATMSLAVATLLSFALAPWYVTVPAALGEFIVSRKLQLGRRVARQVFLSQKYLRDLATSEPGRLTRILSSPSRFITSET